MTDLKSFGSERLRSIGVQNVPGKRIRNIVAYALDIVDETAAVDSQIIDFVGERLAEELEMLARLTNPQGTFRPEWYDDEAISPANELIERSEFSEEFPEELVEMFDIAPKAAEMIVEGMVDVIRRIDTFIKEYYFA